MSRKVSSSSSLENLKREAKRWLRALRSNAADARDRLQRSLGKIPDNPTLRDVQHAIAREHGVSGWSELREMVATHTHTHTHTELVDWFLENACPDHHVRGTPDHIMAQHTAMRVLAKNPEIARHNLYTAIVCGELDHVARVLAERPSLAKEKSGDGSGDRSSGGGDGDRFRKRVGAMAWEPLLYLCFTRLPLAASNDNAIAMARLLLDNGADPNAFFMAGDSVYTPLCGAIGEGEENRPPHPRRNALVELLLDRGANPYDIQVVYNTGFSYGRSEVLWFLKLIYARAVATGRKSDWDDPAWGMLDMGGYGNGARWYLDLALKHNNLELAEWCLAHGASANAPPARDKRFSRRSLFEDAIRGGQMEFAGLLERHGAEQSHVEFKGDDAFTAACMRLDRARAKQMVKDKPRLLKVAEPMMLAAQQDNVAVVEFLLELGMSPDIEQSRHNGQVPLHVAAYAGSLRVVELLVQRGAKVDVFDNEHGGTPLWFAMYGQQQRVVDVLSAVSRDVWTLSLTGNVARLRAVLRDEPQLARAGEKSGETAIFYLPADDRQALEIVELFLSLGTDAAVKNADGLTAADLAEKRGLDEVARLLRGVPGP